jgi:pyruvate kinase
MGEYPVEATARLAKIAAAIEPHRRINPIKGKLISRREDDDVKLENLIALSVETTLERITPPTVIVPTRSGATARSITRFRLPVWITALSRFEKTCQDLLFSYGVLPVHEPEHPDDWKPWARNWLQTSGEVGIKKRLRRFLVNWLNLLIGLFVRTGGGYELKYWKNERTCAADLSGRVTGCRSGGGH